MKEKILLKLLLWFIKSDALKEIKDDAFVWLREKAKETSNSWDDEAVDLLEEVINSIMEKYQKGE